MPAAALLFGAIGTLAECSELQRRACNRAFAEADLDWVWDRASFRRLSRRPGGRARLARYAEDAGDRIDAEALHAATIRHFAALVAEVGLRARPGVIDMIGAARRRGVPVVLATTTSRARIDVVLRALQPLVLADDFAWIGDVTCAARPKPAPDIYAMALARLDLPPDAAVAIEDTPESAEAAAAAGLRVLAFPGEAAAERDFPAGMLAVDRLQPRLLDMGAPIAAE